MCILETLSQKQNNFMRCRQWKHDHIGVFSWHFYHRKVGRYFQMRYQFISDSSVNDVKHDCDPTIHFIFLGERWTLLAVPLINSQNCIWFWLPVTHAQNVSTKRTDILLNHQWVNGVNNILRSLQLMQVSKTANGCIHRRACSLIFI